jgi:hypothetical protein
MKIENLVAKHALVAFLAASAVNIYSAETAAARDSNGDFPKAGLQLWLSAGQVEQADGTITLIKELSGNENQARRDPVTAMPLTNPALAKDAASGQPVLRFSGANVAYVFNQLTNIRTTFWVVCKDPAAFGQRNEKFVLGDKVSNDFHAGWTDDTIFNTVVAPNHLSSYLHDGKTWLNGRPMDASKTPFPKQLGLISIISAGPVRAGQLAQDRNYSGRSWQGDIAEILIYNVELTDADRRVVEKYLLTKYAIKTETDSNTGLNTPVAIPPALEKNRGRTEKKTCRSVAREENH